MSPTQCPSANHTLCFSKDVRLPNQLQRAMAAEAEATREAKAKVFIFVVFKEGSLWITILV